MLYLMLLAIYPLDVYEFKVRKLSYVNLDAYLGTLMRTPVIVFYSDNSKICNHATMQYSKDEISF